MSAQEAVVIVLQRKPRDLLEQSNHIDEELLTNYCYAEDRLRVWSLDHCLGLLSYVGWLNVVFSRRFQMLLGSCFQEVYENICWASKLLEILSEMWLDTGIHASGRETSLSFLGCELIFKPRQTWVNWMQGLHTFLVACLALRVIIVVFLAEVAVQYNCFVCNAIDSLGSLTRGDATLPHLRV